jgi:hypothetical protein
MLSREASQSGAPPKLAMRAHIRRACASLLHQDD